MSWSGNDSDYNSKGYYFADYKPKEGDRVRIEASAPEYKDVFSEVSLPLIVPIEDFYIRKEEEETLYGTQTSQVFYLKFADTPNRKDYYLIYFELGYPDWNPAEDGGFNGKYNYTPLSVEYSKEPLFSSDISALDKVLGYDWLSGYYGRVFSDEQIAGQTYTLRLPYSVYYWYPQPPEGEDMQGYPREKYRVSLYNISESYYNYMKSVLRIIDDTFASSLANGGLAEPIRVYSNIEGGIGILGGGAGASREIEKE